MRTYIKGSPKNLTKMHHSSCVIFLATNVPEGWDIIHLKGEVHSSVWSTKTFDMISGSRDIRKSKWGIRLQRY